MILKNNHFIGSALLQKFFNRKGKEVEEVKEGRKGKREGRILSRPGLKLTYKESEDERCGKIQRSV
jgi:hypothetical protein